MTAGRFYERLRGLCCFFESMISPRGGVRRKAIARIFCKKQITI